MNAIIKFGKYFGKTMSEVFEIDQTWVKNFAKNTGKPRIGFRNKVIQVTLSKNEENLLADAKFLIRPKTTEAKTAENVAKNSVYGSKPKPIDYGYCGDLKSAYETTIVVDEVVENEDNFSIKCHNLKNQIIKFNTSMKLVVNTKYNVEGEIGLLVFNFGYKTTFLSDVIVRKYKK